MAACLKKKRPATGGCGPVSCFTRPAGFLLESLTARLKLPPEKVPIVLDGFGNTVSSTIPIVLGELYRRGALAGKTAMVLRFRSRPFLGHQHSAFSKRNMMLRGHARRAGEHPWTVQKHFA